MPSYPFELVPISFTKVEIIPFLKDIDLKVAHPVLGTKVNFVFIQKGGEEIPRAIRIALYGVNKQDALECVRRAAERKDEGTGLRSTLINMGKDKMVNNNKSFVFHPRSSCHHADIVR